MTRRKVYFNPVQLQFQWIAANTSVGVCGRRFGKTEGMAAPFVLRCFQRMPGSTGGIVVPTFLHGLTNTIPGVLAAFRRWGYIDGIHYVVGRKPPEFFNSPIIKPQSYAHVISFYNGSVAVLLSQDRSYSANSLTLSWLLVDEAKFIDYRKLKDETIPANGGNRFFFGRRSANHAMMILSDMPQTRKGSWFLHYREKMNPELIEVIKAQVHEVWRVKRHITDLRDKGSAVPDYLRNRLRSLDRDLNRLRSVAVYYRECSSIENIEIIGEKYIRQMKRDLTPLTFRCSVLCQRIGVSADGFYSNMTERHKYNASDLAFLDERFQAEIIDGNPVADPSALADADVNPDEPICIGMDYNANINWIVAGQPRGSRLNVIHSFYVKYERKLIELVDDFCDYYASHRRKQVVFYYDSTAIGQNYFVNDRDIHAIVVSQFEARGWEVVDVYIGAPMRHDEKYRLINLGFASRNNLTPFFNRQNNDDLILAMQLAGVERGRLGFRKDKAAEKLPESEENPLELRTDGTDAFDTLYIGCERFPQAASSGFYMTPGFI